MTDSAIAASPSANNTKTILMFAIPSLLGVLLFMMPIFIDGNMSFPLALLAKGLKGVLGESLPFLVVGTICLTALLSVWASLGKPALLKRFPLLNELFCVSPLWLSVRVLGAVLAVMTLNQWGPEAVWSGNTGGLVFNDLLPSLFTMFIFAGLTLPLLLNFGLLELLGTVMSKVMRPLFRLPGRSAIDCLSSWLGDGTVGVILTNQQYEDKVYTQREAAVVATMFSTVGISFSLVVLTQVGLQNYFVPYYLAICLSGVIAAVVIQRLPPLSNKKDLFIDGTERTVDNELVPEGQSVLSFGYQLALARAEQVTSLKAVAAQGAANAMNMVFGIIPVVMAIGTLGLIVAETTSLFSWLGTPFVPFLELLQLPEAAAASETMLVGFTDMFVPSILAASIDSEVTRFVIAALSVSQLIYLSETGAVLMSSKIPVNFVEMVVIFLLRTVITLPIIALVGHLVF